jgi:hypothetical protein
MRRTNLAIAIGVALGVTLPRPAVSQPEAPYPGSRFREVWGQVAADPYEVPPRVEVTLGRLFDGLTDRLLQASRRTLRRRDDLLPWFRKLIHPTGICLAGWWVITEPNRYTGQFRQGTRALIIARASTAEGTTRPQEARIFGFAGKIYPTSDPEHAGPLPTANFFAIEDLAGSRRDHFLDARCTNDILPVSPRPSLVPRSPLLAAAARDFAIADETLDVTQTMVRPLTPLAALGEPAGAPIDAPRWLLVTGSADVPRVDASDYREELRLANYPGGLRFDILVAERGSRLGERAWRKIGHMEFFADAVSDSCDHRLHFHHPRRH